MTIGKTIDNYHKAIEKRLTALEKKNVQLLEHIDFLQKQIIRVEVELFGHIHGLVKPNKEREG